MLALLAVLLAAGPQAKAAIASPAAGTRAGSDGVYELPSDRKTLWQPGVTYNGGIPVRVRICATLSPRGAALDDTDAVQAALNSCPAHQVVKLGPGTFRIDRRGLWPKSRTTLRGSGPGVTTLASTPPGAGSLVIVGHTYNLETGDSRALVADATKDTYSARVASASGLRVGELVNLSEEYDPGLTHYTDPSPLTKGDYMGSGECRCNHFWYVGDTCWSATGCPRWATSASDAMNMSRPLGQVMEIASIAGDTVTFATPFHQTWRVSHKARLSRHNDNGGPPLGLPVTRVGIEDLTVLDGGGTDAAGPLAFVGASYSWAKHVESAGSRAVAVLMRWSFRCELRDSYIHSTSNPNPGGGGYGIGVDAYSADNLIENNISWNFNKVMEMRSSGGGNVIGYNYMQDGWGSGYPMLVEVGLNASHMTTPHHELFEGNESYNLASDTTWGNSIYITWLRNRATGLRSSHTPLVLTDRGNRRMAEVNTGDRWFSFVGNVLGYSGMPLDASMPGGSTKQTRCLYEATQATGDHGADLQVWKLTWADAGWNGAPSAPDTSATILRMGNFDWCTRTQKWHGLGGAGVLGTPPRPAPRIPDSWYLPSKPAFFGSNPWPWVDPSSGATYVLPAKARFDAGTPNVVP